MTQSCDPTQETPNGSMLLVLAGDGRYDAVHVPSGVVDRLSRQARRQAHVRSSAPDQPDAVKVSGCCRYRRRVPFFGHRCR